VAEFESEIAVCRRLGSPNPNMKTLSLYDSVLVMAVLLIPDA